MTIKKLLVLVGLLIVTAVVLAACGGAATPAPAVEPVATEAPATEAPTAVPTVDPAEAIKPIFAASGHADTEALAFNDWNEADPKEVPVSCAKCHSSAGYQDFITDGKVDAAVPAPAGTLECATCHNDTAKAMTSVTFPSGIVIENLGPEAICMTCHQGRQSKVSVDKKFADFAVEDVDAVVLPIKDKDGKDVFFTFPNVHYFAAGGTLYGSQVKMGYEYDGKIYDAKLQHVDGFNTCLGCHDSHSLEVKVETCSECHEGVAAVEDLKNIREPSSMQDYDGDGDMTEGVAFEIEGLQETLLASIKAYATEVAGKGIVYDSASHPYWFLDEDGDGAADLNDEQAPKAYNVFTARLMKATYNYQVSVKDPGAFAHGGKYIIELLVDSIEDVNASEKLTTKFDATTLTREDSGHFNGARETWRHWDFDDDGNPVYTVEAGCAKCHSGSALPMVLAGETIPEAGVPAGNGLMCLTCHDGANFPALIAGKDVTMPSGKVVSFGEGDASNLCIECHQGRTSKMTIDKKIADFSATDMDKVVEPLADGTKFSFSNAHYLGIGAMWFGTDAQGFYEYEGKTYVGTNPHAAVDGKAGCVGCHDPHTGTPKEEACKACHGDVAMDDLRGMSSTGDYNGNGDTKEGMRAEYRVLRDVLYTELQKYAKTTGTGITYNPDVYPYWFVDANGDDKADEADGKTVAFSAWTPRLMKAAYNYNFLRKNPDVHIHNGKYGIQIVIDTIEDLGGDVTKFVRP
jgi:hypothetical protein